MIPQGDTMTTTTPALDDEERAELQAHRDGIGHLAEDPMHAGQPVHEEIRYSDGEPVYRLQITHAFTPLWQCCECRKLTIGTVGYDPVACVGCGLVEVLAPLLYPTVVECRRVTGRAGPCLIAGSDGCECPAVGR
jgi:hypothetical protein